MTSYAAGLWAHLIAGVIFIHVFVVSAGVIVFALIIAGYPQGEKGKTTRKRQTKRDAIELLLLKNIWLFCILKTYGYFQCSKVNFKFTINLPSGVPYIFCRGGKGRLIQLLDYLSAAP